MNAHIQQDTLKKRIQNAEANTAEIIKMLKGISEALEDLNRRHVRLGKLKNST